MNFKITIEIIPTLYMILLLLLVNSYAYIFNVIHNPYSRVILLGTNSLYQRPHDFQFFFFFLRLGFYA